jgi:myo-inositol catabolism protein IolC
LTQGTITPDGPRSGGPGNLAISKQKGFIIMAVGYDRPLYVLPFDHRGTFQKNMFGWTGELTAEQTVQIAAMKWAIYDGFKAALADGVPQATAGILVDEQFGADILRDAAKRGYVNACPAEKSGQDEFDFEYGDDFAHHLEALSPTFCKVLVRYNPEGDSGMNRRQAERLKLLSDFLHSGGPSRFMFELLVPATQAQLARSGGDKKEYDRGLRPELMVRAISELQGAGIEPDVWKIEGIDRQEDCAWVVAAARRGGRDSVGCIVLGRGEDDAKVRQWLTTAAAVPGFIGFAVGRTSFWGPLTDWKEGRIAREAAVREIARRYQEWVNIFESARSSGGAPVARGGRI